MATSCRWSAGRTPTGNPFRVRNGRGRIFTARELERCKKCSMARHRHEDDGLIADQEFVEQGKTQHMTGAETG